MNIHTHQHILSKATTQITQYSKCAYENFNWSS